MQPPNYTMVSPQCNPQFSRSVPDDMSRQQFMNQSGGNNYVKLPQASSQQKGQPIIVQDYQLPHRAHER